MYEVYWTRANRIKAAVIAFLLLSVGTAYMYKYNMSILKARLDLFDFIFCLPIAGPFLAIAFYVIFAVKRITSEITPDSVSSVAKAFVWIACVFLSGYVVWLEKRFFDPGTAWSLTGIMLVGILLYAGLRLLLLRLFGLPNAINWRRRRNQAHIFFMIFAILFWGALVGVVGRLVEPEKFYFESPLILAAIVMAWGTYRLGMYLALRNRPVAEDNGDVQAVEPTAQ
ncbi:hypothetical protein STSP2_02409 [Anaerohalosphaera lusitana]|uniref:Uncharacterized protein n=1 Tax=Anaerohalosphaera lusitana TaxID=1936003 RepID=A0A1U9NNM7_9BACT|nr:hypothetical protein [Anaerohalosphaera lusitana]AQT69220.1 hypothetical protein STSP2_02409 [Anaerohalosphaera lusitana]